MGLKNAIYILLWLRSIFMKSLIYWRNNIMPHEENFVNTIPVGKLGIIAHKSSQSLGEKVDKYIVHHYLNYRS